MWFLWIKFNQAYYIYAEVNVKPIYSKKNTSYLKIKYLAQIFCVSCFVYCFLIIRNFLGGKGLLRLDSKSFKCTWYNLTVLVRPKIMNKSEVKFYKWKVKNVIFNKSVTKLFTILKKSLFFQIWTLVNFSA